MSIESRIAECEELLKDLGLPESVYKRKVANLTFLALCNIKPNDSWRNASKQSMTVNNDIMAFVNNYYRESYATGSRESFRKQAIHPFLEYRIIQLNPDNPNLKPNNANTHYAISDLVLETVRKYNTSNWREAVKAFKQSQFSTKRHVPYFVRKLNIENYKSILKDEIELGRFNVFIGENGCGKSNILEALALFSASKTDDLDFDGLYNKGVRIARPDLMLSSFLERKQNKSINISLEINDFKEGIESSIDIEPKDSSDIYTKWIDKKDENLFRSKLTDILSEYFTKNNDNIDEGFADFDEILKTVRSDFNSMKTTNDNDEIVNDLIADYGIFDLNTKSLRGIVPVDSRRTPLGLNGEGLDLLISTFDPSERKQLLKCIDLFSWLVDVKSDKNDRMKMEGLKPGRSSSTLYFTDRFMQKQNNTLSAENSNEGILHVLFYLALFISNKTPNFFAIDNIETALNPKLCQKLIKILVVLAKERGKQVLITTHNPAILDGLNVTDDDQRLFEVYRTSDGNTRTRRIKFKSDLSDKGLKLSEMWMNGALGAIPTNF